MKKGVVLVIVIGIFLVVATLSMASLYLMTQQARINEHKIKRMKARSVAQAAMVKIYAQLRDGQYGPDSSTQTTAIPFDIDGDGIDDMTANVTISPAGSGSAPSGVRPVDITVDY